MFQSLQAAFQSLQPSEQRLLRWALPLILLMLLVLWKPWQKSEEDDWLILEPSLSPAEQLAILQSAQLTPVSAVDPAVWQEQALSHGLRRVRLQPEGEQWLMQAEAPNPDGLEAFARWAANQGWYWQSIEFSGQPMQLRILWVSR